MLPSAKEVYDRYLSASATDKKGKKYVFEDGEPEHFKLLECVLSDAASGDRFNEDADFAAEVDDLVCAAEALYNNDEDSED